MSIKLKKSNYMSNFLVTTHCAAIVALWLTVIPLWLTVILSILVLCSLIYHWQHFIRQCLRHSIISFWHQDTVRWGLQFANGGKCFALLQASSYISRYLLIMRFQEVDRKNFYTIVLFVDAVSSLQYKYVRRTVFTNVPSPE